DIAGSSVPSSVWQHAKRGFTFPWSEWLGNGRPLHRVADDAVNDTSRWRDLGIDASAVRKTWTQFVGGDERSLLFLMASVRAAKPNWQIQLIAGSDGPLIQRATEMGVDASAMEF